MVFVRLENTAFQPACVGWYRSQKKALSRFGQTLYCFSPVLLSTLPQLYFKLVPAQHGFSGSSNFGFPGREMDESVSTSSTSNALRRLIVEDGSGGGEMGTCGVERGGEGAVEIEEGEVGGRWELAVESLHGLLQKLVVEGNQRV